MVSVMGLLCGQTYSFFCYSRGPKMSQSLTQSGPLVTGGSGGGAQVDSKQATEGDLGEGIFWEPWMGKERWDLVSQVNQDTILSGARPTPSLCEGSKRRASSSRPPQEQTSEGLTQNNNTEGQYACNPECSQLGCIKHAGWQVHHHNEFKSPIAFIGFLASLIYPCISIRLHFVSLPFRLYICRSSCNLTRILKSPVLFTTSRRFVLSSLERMHYAIIHGSYNRHHRQILPQVLCFRAIA